MITTRNIFADIVATHSPLKGVLINIMMKVAKPLMVKTSNYLTKGFSIEFQKCNTKLECPFVIYGDFECLTVNSNDGIKGTY